MSSTTFLSCTRIVRDSSSSGTVPRSAVCTKTSPCWINREAHLLLTLQFAALHVAEL